MCRRRRMNGENRKRERARERANDERKKSLSSVLIQHNESIQQPCCKRMYTYIFKLDLEGGGKCYIHMRYTVQYSTYMMFGKQLTA